MRTLLTLALVAAAVPMMAFGHGGPQGTPSAAKGATSTATANAYVNVVAPVFVESTQDLSFGVVLMDAYNLGGTVTMLTDSKDNVDPTIKSTDYKDCAAYGGTLSPAFFHYKKDSRFPVTVTVQDTVVMGRVSCKLNNDLPGDACGVFNPLPSQVEAKHFGVGGTLTIPANTFGEQTGSFTVTVAYN